MYDRLTISASNTTSVFTTGSNSVVLYSTDPISSIPSSGLPIATTDNGVDIIRSIPDKYTPPELGPKLYFSFVKSKFKQTEIAKIVKMIEPLRTIIEGARVSGQTGLYEELMTTLAVLLRVQEAAALNFVKYVNKTDIDKFMNIVRGKTVEFSRLSEFTRPLPTSVLGRLTFAKDRGIFDEFWVLFNNPTKEKPKKSNKEKIVEKDPILFGKFSYDLSGNFYHIASWEDEYCDLTLDKFVDELKKESVLSSYQVSKIRPITVSEVERIKSTVQEKYDRLKTTNRDNWRSRAAEEDTKSPSIIDRIKNLFRVKK